MTREQTAPDHAGEESLPPGHAYLTVRTTFLEMRRPDTPAEAALPAVPPDFTITRWQNPPLDEYRTMYHVVGDPWGWTGRLLLSNEELQALLADERIEVWRLRRGAELAGFVELDGRAAGEVEIVYLGLRPEFIGQGLGRFALGWTVRHVWQRPEVERLWLHTCDFDHPKALAVYLKAGFRIYDERVGPEAYPAEFVERLRR